MIEENTMSQEKIDQTTTPNIDLSNDVVNDIVQKIQDSRKDVKGLVDNIMDVIKKYFNDNPDIKSSELVKRAYIATAGAIFSISQGFYENEEEYLTDLEKIRQAGVEKIVPIIMQLGDENPDMLAFYRIMMSLGASIDYVFWQNDFSKYSALRAEKEAQNAE